MVEIIEKHVCENSVKYQIFVGFIVNLLSMGYGFTSGWSSTSLLILTSNESPLPTGKITSDESSWIASINCIGGLIGSIVFGFITNRFGRKKPLIYLSLMKIIAWIFVLYAQNVYHLYISRLLNGIVGGGVLAITPLFVTEISDDRVRGFLGSILIMSVNIGILLSFILGYYCEYFFIPKVVISICVLFIALIISFPDSPMSLYRRNNIKEAKASIRFYKNLREKDGHHCIDVAMNNMKNTLSADSSDESAFDWFALLRNPGKKALQIGVGLALLNPFSGISALLSYTATIFEDAGSALTPQASSIFVGCILLIGSFIAMYLVEKAGRKLLYAISTFGTALGFFVLGVYNMLAEQGWNVETLNFIPIASFSFVLFLGSFGILTLPFVVIAEIFPEKQKHFGASLCTSLIWFFAFLVVKYLPTMKIIVGFHGSMIAFGGVCLLSFILIVLFLPETRGKSHEQIMNMLR